MIWTSVHATARRQQPIRRARRVAITALLLSGPLQAQPEAVSPGLPDRPAPMRDGCSTFSWSAIEGGLAYEIAVFAVGAESDSSAPVLRRHLPATLSWTPALDECLPANLYAWVVRGKTARGWSAWSQPRRFDVPWANGQASDAPRPVEDLSGGWPATLPETTETARPLASERETRSSPSPNERRSAASELRHAALPCQAGQEFFQDVPASSPFCGWIEQLARHGISEGCGAGNYCPLGVVTRQQLAFILERARQDLTPRRQLDVSPRHSCVVLASGRVECWGGFGDESTPPALSFSSVSAGLNHTCGVTRDGPATCWPAGWPAPPARTFLSVSAGYNHDCGVLADSTIACWGNNDQDEATPPAGTFSSVSAGGSPPFGHTCGVRTDGTLSCWGYWQHKEPTPTGKFLAVSAGGRHTCGLRMDGTVACFGFNDVGQSTAPVGTFLSVSAGDAHTCAVKADGTVACWGNGWGQVTPPSGLFSSVSAGQFHNCGTRLDGAVVCWGATGWGAETPPAWLQ